jgi:kynurenine aminotransferase
MIQDPFKPAKRVAGQRQDVWCAIFTVLNQSGITDLYRRSIVNEAAEQSQVKPMVNMGQGFFGYNRKKDAKKSNRGLMLT